MRNEHSLSLWKPTICLRLIRRNGSRKRRKARRRLQTGRGQHSCTACSLKTNESRAKPAPATMPDWASCSQTWRETKRHSRLMTQPSSLAVQPRPFMRNEVSYSCVLAVPRRPRRSSARPTTLIPGRLLPCHWGMPTRRHINRDQGSFFCGGRWPTRGLCRRRRDSRPALRWAMHTPTPNSMIKPQVASRERLEYYRAQPLMAAVASVMKLPRSNEHRRNDPTVAARASSGAAFGQKRAAPRLRNSRRRCARLPYGLAELALVGALLLSSMAGIPSVGAAQTPSAGSTKETRAAFSNLEKLRLTLALARSYRLTEQPQRALDILTP